MDETRGSQHCITVELTFLGRFDLAGEYIAAEKKVLQCPVDIRAVTEVDCLVLSVGTFWLDLLASARESLAYTCFDRRSASYSACISLGKT